MFLFIYLLLLWSAEKGMEDMRRDRVSPLLRGIDAFTRLGPNQNN